MFQYECSVPPCNAADVRRIKDPQARLLVDALEGCCHPQAERLRARLQTCHDADELQALRAEVLNLLALSFGRPEAESRLQLQ